MPISGSYTAVTLAQAVAAVAARLSDPAQVHWVEPELILYVQEALRTWNALTGTWKGTLAFNTADPALNANTPFFSLPALDPALRGMTVTTSQAVTLLAYWLLEPPLVAGLWSGSDQFGYLDLVAALQRRRDQFLLETSAVIARATYPIAPPPDGRVPLPETIVTVRRAAWTTVPGVTTPIQRDDEWSANSYQTGWPQRPGVPRIFSEATDPILYLQLVPPPLDTGTLDLCTVNRGTQLGTDVPIGIPDDWVWVVLFGALADLLSRDGLAYDPSRAAYCEARWQHGLTLAALAPVTLTARIDNQVCRVATLPDLDQFKRSWQNGTAQPRTLVTLGQNLVALVPPPSTNAPSGWGVTLDVVRNAPVPNSPGAFLPIGPELLDTILDYAQHLALVKEGPTELQGAQELLTRFFRASGVEIGWQAALQLQRQALHDQTPTDRRGPSPAIAPQPAITTGTLPGGPY